MWQYQIIKNQRHLRQHSQLSSAGRQGRGGEVFQTSGRGSGRGARLCSGPGAVLGPINPPNSPASFKDKEAEAQRGRIMYLRLHNNWVT